MFHTQWCCATKTWHHKDLELQVGVKMLFLFERTVPLNVGGLLSDILKVVRKGEGEEAGKKLFVMKRCWCSMSSERPLRATVLNMALSWPHFGQDNEHPWKAFLSFLRTCSSFCAIVKGAYLCESSICLWRCGTVCFTFPGSLRIPWIYVCGPHARRILLRCHLKRSLRFLFPRPVS